MSTKVTLDFTLANDENDFHLYLECGEKDCAFLELRNYEFLEVTQDKVVVKLPKEVVEKILNNHLVDRFTKNNTWVGPENI